MQENEKIKKLFKNAIKRLLYLVEPLHCSVLRIDGCSQLLDVLRWSEDWRRRWWRWVQTRKRKSFHSFAFSKEWLLLQAFKTRVTCNTMHFVVSSYFMWQFVTINNMLDRVAKCRKESQSVTKYRKGTNNIVYI